MENSINLDEADTLSLESFDETNKPVWYGLIKHFSHKDLETLRDIFKEELIDNKDIGITKDQFKEAVCSVCGNAKYRDQSVLLFENIADDKIRITWNDFLDFLIENISPKVDYPIQLHIRSIEAVPHMSRETIAKIVVIETEKYFCYAVVSKHGRIGIYDGNLNFLTSYHVIMSREDEERTDDERRRKNRWVTDAVFCLDIQMFIVTNSTRSFTIYEASGLTHEPYWLIIEIPEIVQCLSYKGVCKNKCLKLECILFGGTALGDILLFNFYQPEALLLRRKHADKLSIFHWNELRHEKTYLKIGIYKNVHCCELEQMEYNEQEDSIISCSKDPDASLVKKFISVSKAPYILKISKGCVCFAFSNFLNIIVTGSNDKLIRIWNSVLSSNVIAILKGNTEKILDVAIMDTQHMILSFMQDGLLKVWDINDNKCLQTVNVDYPAYNILGKLIEYGRRSIYPGPKRTIKDLVSKPERSLYKKYFGISEVEERSIIEDEHIKSACLCKWERSNILVTCCNYIASIRIFYTNQDCEKANEMTILPPPPLQNSVLIPAYWQIPTDMLYKHSDEGIEENVENAMKKLDFIIGADLFDIEGSRNDINYKIAILETKKMELENHVVRGAPYLALDLSSIEEVKLSDNLRRPDNKYIKDIVENIRKIIRDASIRDKAFSEPTSNRSPRSHHYEP